MSRTQQRATQPPETGKPGGRLESLFGERAVTMEPRCIAVAVADAVFGLPLDEVREVIGIRPLTRVFHAPMALCGVTSLRGEVLPVIDLGVLLADRPTATTTADVRILVVRERGAIDRRAGVLVDALLGLRDLPQSGLGEPPRTLSDAKRALIRGVIVSPPPCAVVDISAVLGAPDLATLAGKVDAEP